MRSIWYAPDIMNIMKIVYRSGSLLRVIINLCLTCFTMYTDTLCGKRAVSSSNNLVALHLVNKVLKIFALI